ncbi:Fc.00g008200.m01.CDS01 [Cosmosporella sp. VM-42]
MPLLWADPFQTARLASLDSDDKNAWWFNFVFVTLERAPPETRALIHVLDLRGFTNFKSYSFTVEFYGKTIQSSFKRVVELLPSLRCLLLDGYASEELQTIHSRFLGRGSGSGLRLLSLVGYSLPVPEYMWVTSALGELVYLDISGIPGSIWAIIKPQALPRLEILKIRNREIGDDVFKSLAMSFRDQLWSLDVTSNKLTDEIIDSLVKNCFSEDKIRSSGSFDIEGMLWAYPDYDLPDCGPLVKVVESVWSGYFCHPDRYLAGAPGYPSNNGPPPRTRKDGISKIRQDSEESMVRELSSPDFWEWSSHLNGVRKITHLNVSNNQISSHGIERLLIKSRGHLEYFACNYTPFVAPPRTYARIWPKTATLCGILSAAYTLRPVISANLRALSMHHSIVTQIPTLEIEGRSTLARWYLAETSILTRSEKAYPQAFVPDMNPRLTSLTLTGIPRRSAGPLTGKLIDFLKALSVQERAILDMARMVPLRRGPVILKGLREFRLEFELDPVEDDTWTDDDLNAEELMNTGEQGFSFFDDERGGPSQAQASIQRSPETDSNSNGVAQMTSIMRSDRELGDWIYHQVNQREGAESVRYEVWIGTKRSHPNPIINDYRRLVVDCNLRKGLGPASPAHVLAGVPRGAFIFHIAWCVAVMPPELEAPRPSDLKGMKDVLAELRRFREEGKAMDQALRYGEARVDEGEPPPYWHGNLTVSFTKPL